MQDIYISPEALEIARDAWMHANIGDSVEAACRALIQYIVENPRHMARLLSEQEKQKLWDVFNEHLGWQPILELALRLAFTAPQPSVPEEVVAILDKRLVVEPGTCFVSIDAAREAAVEAYEAGLAKGAK